MKPETVFALEQADWPAMLVDTAGVVHHANPAAHHRFATSWAGGSPRLTSIWSPENEQTADHFLAQSEMAPVPILTLKFRAPDGAAVPCQTSVCVLAGEGPKRFLLQLLGSGAGPFGERPGSGDTGMWHRQKLDCALQLARTVAHDFNNALTSILGHASHVLGQMEPNHPWRAALLEVEKSAGRAAEIASDLAAFSHQEKDSRAQASGNLNSLLQRCVDILRRNGEPVAVEWSMEFEHKLLAAKFDEAKMQQAFLKILENAIESLREDGRISVQTRNVELSGPKKEGNVALAKGSYVAVEITDNGSGIAANVLPRIFEPFFTTKRGGKHRGLGLAWVYGIVTNHGGGVSVSSRPGSGTSVRVHLPAENRIVKDHLPHPENLRGTQRILMVDDEEIILTLGQTILSAHGYHIRTAASAQRALELLAQPGAAIDLVITDLVMPGMGGRELAEQVHRLYPGTRVLSTSGYVWSADQPSGATYLQKPFTSQELLVQVKAALAAE
jgi:nitrogen-specific signal transduction histidine kinase